MNDLEKDQLNEYKSALKNLISKSQDAFEKQLSLISTGSIGVSLLIVEKFFERLSDTIFKGVLIFGWGLMVSTLLLNLFSHRIAERSYSNTVHEIETGRYDPDKANKRANKVGKFNFWSGVFVTAGISLFLLFIILNLFYYEERGQKKYPAASSTPTKGDGIRKAWVSKPGSAANTEAATAPTACQER